jgi:hypothetical protein
MEINEIREIIEEARGWINSAVELTGELTKTEGASVSAYIAMAKSLTAIAMILEGMTCEAGYEGNRPALRVMSYNAHD